jgi:hypothetical protein
MVKCCNNQTCECVFRLEVVLSVSLHDHVLFLNTRCQSGLHIMNVYESDVLCDHVVRTEMDVSGDSSILLGNKAKSTEFY